MKSSKYLLLVIALLVNLALGLVTIAVACSRISPFKISELFTADLIVRATAVKYITSPDPKRRTTGVPDSTIEFKVEETIWGVDVPASITLNGYLSEKDDFNDIPLPYRFVRRNGRAGSCFANTYKEGAQFLLFVRKLGYPFAEYTIDISPLGPTNEQLRSADDPWIKWVKAYLSPCVEQEKGGTEFANMPKAKMNAKSKEQNSDLDKYRLAKCYLAKYGTDSPEAKNYMKIVDSYESRR